MTARTLLAACLVSSALLLPACHTSSTSSSSAPTTYSPVPGASGGRVYDGFAGYHRAVTTSSPEAQRFIDQGFQLMYGFNHDEAIRSFEEAAAIDPSCAMAFWGIAYCNGININDPLMSELRGKQAYAAAQQAMRLRSKASPVEAALIDAVCERYAYPPPTDRKHLDEAYAAAMERVWLEHTGDPDVGVLYAESLMNLQPWNYWTKSGEPKGRTLQFVYAIEKVLAAHPNHPGANHFYIHAVEASPNPDRALAAADRLINLVPGSGHLVHMPSHIYIRTGRYDAAAEANKMAIAADEKYFAVAPPPQYYNLYFLHNIHFLAFSCMMEGRSAEALAAADKLQSQIPEHFVRENTGVADGVMSTRLHALVRFGMWDKVLEEPEPVDYRLVSRAVRHYARGIAYSAKGRPADARREQQLFKQAVAKVPLDWMVFQNKLHDVLPIAEAMLEGEILYREGKKDEAYAVLRRGIAAEDKLVYDEPPGWMLPVRHALGALLMGDGKAAEAEKIYREDLANSRDNAWALLGLEKSLRAQGKTAEADELKPRLTHAWARADINPTSSCFCQPGVQ